jgi:hypothetical protein
MNEKQINALSPVALFRKVFGQHEGQSLTQFLQEAKPLKDNEAFVAEVRAFALTGVAPVVTA